MRATAMTVSAMLRCSHALLYYLKVFFYPTEVFPVAIMETNHLFCREVREQVFRSLY